MSRRLDDLDPRFRPLAVEWIARCVESGIAVMIVDTLRTPAEHAANLANGTSWTRHSKHLVGLAIDLCPYETYHLHKADKLQWDERDPAWQIMGRHAEDLGLVWGGRWKKRDMGHAEYPTALIDTALPIPHQP